MATFSTNAVRQFYVIKNVLKGNEELTNTGDIAVKVSDAGFGKKLYFQYKGADTVLHSDDITVKNIDYAKATGADDMAYKLKKVEVTLGNEKRGYDGELVVGQDYILRIVLRQFFGMSDRDVYYKEGLVHVTKGMDKAKFYKDLKESLDLSFSREVGATKTENPYLKFTAEADKLVIEEKEQTWIRGIRKKEPVLFDAEPTFITVDGTEVQWGEAKQVKSTTAYGNGAKIADLEYFCLGERGDQYRMVGFPDYVPTTYLTDATKEYDVLDIHFAFTDDGVNSYRSEKDITFVAEKQDSEANSIINKLIAEIKSVAGVEIDEIKAAEEANVQPAKANTIEDELV